MNFKHMLLGLIFLTPASFLSASDADGKRSADGLQSQINWSQFKDNMNEMPHRPEKENGLTAEWYKEANQRLPANQKNILNSMDKFNDVATANDRLLEKNYSLKNAGFYSSIRDEVKDKVFTTFILALVTGVVKVSFDWAMTSKEEQQERRAALKYNNLSSHDNLLSRQYQNLTYQRAVVGEMRKIAANTKDAEQRKAILEQCDLREKELSELKCKLDDAILNFMKQRDDFFNPRTASAPAKVDAKQALTEQEISKKPVTAPAA